jgi:hypothetical protein
MNSSSANSFRSRDAWFAIRGDDHDFEPCKTKDPRIQTRKDQEDDKACNDDDDDRDVEDTCATESSE